MVTKNQSLQLAANPRDHIGVALALLLERVDHPADLWVAREAGLRKVSQTPKLKHLFGLYARLGTRMRPIDQRTPSISTEPLRAWPHAHAAQVEPVGIPARLLGRIAIGQTICMQSAGLIKQFKAIIIEMHECAAQLTRKITATLAVAVVSVFIHPP